MSFAPDTYTECTDPNCPYTYAFRSPYPTIPHWHPKEPDMTEPETHEILCPFDHANCFADDCECECHARDNVRLYPGPVEPPPLPSDVDWDALADEAELGYDIHDDGSVDTVAQILHATTDAAVWAHHFKAQFGDTTPDEYTMLTWFANAIETGRTAGLNTGIKVIEEQFGSRPAPWD